MDHSEFSRLASILLLSARSTVQSWIPGGRLIGNEYCVKNPTRDDKKAGSFYINVNNGKWIDFATGDKGGDLISLYAYINNVSNFEAFRMLSIL